MSIIYALVGTNRVLRHSNSNNQIVIGDFNSFSFFLGHPVQCVPKKSTLYRNYPIVIRVLFWGHPVQGV